MTTSNLIQFSQVDFSYGEKAILKAIHFEVKAGSLVGILGPNGSGKTTLLKMMAGVLAPKHGEVSLMGQPIHQIPRHEIAKKISVLAQDNPVEFPFRSIEIVLMGRAPYLKRFQWESAQDIQIAHEAMELADCRHLAERDILTLSGGERERVFLARALAQQTQILLLDEPTTHLDLKHQYEIRQLLLKLQKERGLTIITVVHDLNFATQICEQVLLLSGQRLIGSGSPEQVLTEEKVHDVYGVAVNSGMHPQNQKPIFFF